MNLRLSDDDGSVHESNGDGAEIVRAVRISLCGLDLSRPASFVPVSAATADFDWQLWMREVFLNGVGAAFVEVFQFAGRMQVRELMEVDQRLDSVTSREAGAALLDRLEEAKSVRVVERMRSILDGVPGPHFATAFAVECVEFYLPLRSALISYLYGEWRCGMSVIGQRGDLGAFEKAGGKALSAAVGAVLALGTSPFDQVSGL